MASKWLYSWTEEEVKRPPLQLHFTGQGAEKVLPLSIENVASVFKTGVLTVKGDMPVKGGIIVSMEFGGWLGIPGEHHANPLSAATWWVNKGRDRSWRTIIYYLDMAGETGVADELISYSEPPSDSSVTVERVTPIFMNMRDWTRVNYYIIVPPARAEVIRGHYEANNEQRAQGATYYVHTYPWASWGDLAGKLYQSEEKRAVEAFKTQLPKPKDPTLTKENIISATEGVEMPKESTLLAGYLDMPKSTYNMIVGKHGTGKEGRRALFSEFLSHHPYPRWEVVVELLEKLKKKGKARAGLAQEVKEKYLTKPAVQQQSEETLEQNVQKLDISQKSNEKPEAGKTCEKDAASPKKPISYEIDITDLEFRDVLGEGGFGTVFKGKWKSKGIDVALKSARITPDASDAEVMRELGDHPNIIYFYGFAYRRPETIIVTALAMKGSLYDLLHVRKEKPTQQQSLTWAKHIAYGMAYMHKLDYVHRDLKSSNVLFSDDMVAQVCDFGTARIWKKTRVATKVTGTGRWMAPEVARDDAINKQCDVFSFALVVWELMEHNVPYPEARTDVMASMSIINGKRPPIGSKWPKYLSSLTQACWADAPNDRPTFSDIVASLESKIYFKR